MKRPAKPHEARAELLLLVVVVIWASNFPIAKFGIAGLNPFVFNALRYLVAGCVVGFLFAIKGHWVPVAREDRIPVVRLAIIGSIVYQMAFMYGLSLTSAGNSAVLLSTAPLWTVLVSARLHGESIPRATIAGMLVSFVGVCCIVLGSGKKLEFGSTPLAGDILILGAACLWGVNTNLQKPLLARYSALQLTLIMTLVGSVGLTIVALPTLSSLHGMEVGWTHVSAAVVSGALSIGTANLFWSMGVKRLGPGRTANFNNLVPVLAFLISFLVLGEQFSGLQMAGAAITIAGVVLARR